MRLVGTAKANLRQTLVMNYHINRDPALGDAERDVARGQEVRGWVGAEISVSTMRQPVPLGVPREIVIGGAGIGNNEYLSRADVTADHFPAYHFTPRDRLGSGWGRMYRTGDYGRLDAGGMLKRRAQCKQRPGQTPRFPGWTKRD